MKILLVDDELELVSALSERLSFRGFETDWATNAEDAIAKVSTAKYDLAILDVKMPRIGGLELRKELEKICPSLKYIFLSGHGSEDDYKEGSSGADCYLIKPVKIENLVERINLALGL